MLKCNVIILKYVQLITEVLVTVEILFIFNWSAIVCPADVIQKLCSTEGMGSGKLSASVQVRRQI